MIRSKQIAVAIFSLVFSLPFVVRGDVDAQPFGSSHSVLHQGGFVSWYDKGYEDYGQYDSYLDTDLVRKTLFIPKFDPSLGTLSSVQVSSNGTTSLSWDYRWNLDLDYEDVIYEFEEVYFYLHASTSVTLPGGYNAFKLGKVETGDNTYAYAPEGWNYETNAPNSSEDNGSLYYTFENLNVPIADLSPYVGIGYVDGAYADYDVHTSLESYDPFGKIYAEATVTGNLIVSGQVEYTYAPAGGGSPRTLSMSIGSTVPEPVCCAFVLGLSGIALRRNR